uniref:PCI domain-containing protein n=1 Tax=Globodera pallida TaxID=36090 RepID=A0A183BKP2_GLOPA
MYAIRSITNMALTRLQHFTKMLSLPATRTTTTAAANTGGAAHVAGRSVEYERCLHAMLVMAQVFAPTLASKQWAKFQTVPQLSAQLQQQTEGRAISDQKWPELDVKEHIDFLLLLCSSSVCVASVPVSAVVGLQDAELEQYAREHCHARFFQLLQEKDIAIRAGRIERIPGLCIVLNLEMADGVHKRSLSEIAQQISKERRARGGDGTEMAEDEGEEAMA